LNQGRTSLDPDNHNVYPETDFFHEIDEGGMSTIELKQTGDLIRLILRKPPLNYLNIELLREFEAHLEALGDATDCRSLIVESEGKAFSAGLDMSEQTEEQVFLLIEQFHRVARALKAFPCPTIAAVRGIALGAGNELAACCDFVIASEAASFGQPEIKFGSIPSLAPLVLPALIGDRRTIELILTGDLLTAKDAHQIGLIYSVVPEEKVEETVQTLVGKFRKMSLPILQIAVESLRGSIVRALSNQLREVESLYLDRMMDLEDCKEGIKAFIEKRPPKWRNC
jgi:cyclohexa-1,5-dienecarbonyl-CoA hydratase